MNWLRRAICLSLLWVSTSHAQTVIPGPPTQAALNAILNPSQTVNPSSGLLLPSVSDIAWSPAVSTTGIVFGHLGRVTLSGANAITGTGHAVGNAGWLVNTNTTTTPLLIALEGKFENTNGGTITTAFGNDSNLTSTNGPITNFFAYPVQNSNITALIGAYYGFYFPATVGVSGNTVAPTTIYAYANLEPAAFTYTVGPVLTTNTATFGLDVSTATHYDNTSAVPTISACGTSPPAATAGSSNSAGQFTLGTGTPTACTVTFANAYNTTAFCTLTPVTAITTAYSISAQSKTSFTVTLVVGTNSVKFNYVCGGN